MPVYVCRWVAGGASIKDSIKAKDRKEAFEKATQIAKENNWSLRAVVASWIELRISRPEKQ